MSLLHCPLCVGLALLSLLRAGAHLVLLERLLLWTPPLRTSAAH
ncbi:MAG: hypothetical protein RLZZ516_345 [Cyanobacteriota bacterium]|jgi:hypothetical protein